MNSSQKEINVPFLSKKESHCDRCTYRGFLFLHLFHCFWKVGVLRVPYVIVLKMQKILYLFWFQKVMFFLPGGWLWNGNLLKSVLFSKLQIFYRFCDLFVFWFYRMGFLAKGSDLMEKLHQIYWFSGCDLHLLEAPGLRKPLAILRGQKRTSEIYDFWKNS